MSKFVFLVLPTILISLMGCSEDGSYDENIPTNSKIAFVGLPIYGDPDRDDLSFPLRSEIYVMDADGTNVVNLTNHPADDSAPAWSPDGTKMAFSSDRGGHSDIYVMDADGTNVVNLTNDPARDTDAAWSSDGAKIAFASTRDDYHGDIYAINTNGTNLVNLTNASGCTDMQPSWSQDGRKIAFASERYGNFDIYVMDADGTNVVNLTREPDPTFRLNTGPSWSPDGERIAFASQRYGDWNVYVMDADGGNPVNLTNNKAGSEDNLDWYFLLVGLTDWSPFIIDTSVPR